MNNAYFLTATLWLTRTIVGLIFFAHGSQKVFGWFGGDGLTATVAKMGMGPVGYLVAIGECFGGLGLMVGFLSRFSAAANLLIMFGAIAMVHGAHGFFQANGGFEYNLALIGLLIPTLLLGPGEWSFARKVGLPTAAE